MEIIDKHEDGDRSFIVYYDNDDGFVSALEVGGNIYLKRSHGSDLNGAYSDHHSRMRTNGINNLNGGK